MKGHTLHTSISGYHGPQEDGSTALIPTLDIKESTKGLGVYFNVVGDGIDHLSNIREKGMTWIDKMCTKPWPTRDVCMSFFLQLFPGMTVGLLTVNMTQKEIEAMIRSL